MKQEEEEPETGHSLPFTLDHMDQETLEKNNTKESFLCLDHYLVLDCQSPDRDDVQDLVVLLYLLSHCRHLEIISQVIIQ